MLRHVGIWIVRSSSELRAGTRYPRLNQHSLFLDVLLHAAQCPPERDHSPNCHKGLTESRVALLKPRLTVRKWMAGSSRENFTKPDGLAHCAEPAKRLEGLVTSGREQCMNVWCHKNWLRYRIWLRRNDWSHKKNCLYHNNLFHQKDWLRHKSWGLARRVPRSLVGRLWVTGTDQGTLLPVAVGLPVVGSSGDQRNRSRVL